MRGVIYGLVLMAIGLGIGLVGCAVLGCGGNGGGSSPYVGGYRGWIGIVRAQPMAISIDRQGSIVGTRDGAPCRGRIQGDELRVDDDFRTIVQFDGRRISSSECELVKQ